MDNATSVTIRTTQTQAQYNQLNEIKNWGTESYAYDFNGNLLSGDGTRSYKWDAENRLIEIDYSAGGKSQFTYDGLGRRVEDSETASGGGVTTSYFLWCDDGHLCQVRDSIQNPLRRDLSEGEYFTVSGQRVVYMPDQLGSVRDILDGAAGTLTSAYNYYPYGTINQHYNSGVRLDYRFAGLFYHPASGLNLGTYRAQDGVTGRFISRDPIGFLGGINLYDYSVSNPINIFDPLGLCGDHGNKKPPCYPNVKKFVSQHLADAQALASELPNGTTAQEILATAAAETTYGSTNSLAPHGNYFGIHGTGYAGQTGDYKTTGGQLTPEFPLENGFMLSGQVFVNTEAPFLSNVDASNPLTFFNTIHAHGYGTTSGNYMKKVMSNSPNNHGSYYLVGACLPEAK